MIEHSNKNGECPICDRVDLMAGGVCEPCFFRFFLEDRLTYWKTEGVYQLKLGFEEILICDVCYIRDGEYLSADTMKVMCEVDFQEFSKHEKTYVVEGKQITCKVFKNTTVIKCWL